MRTNFSTALVFLAIYFSLPFAQAATVQVVTGIENSEFLDGVNLTDDSPVVFINADWTFNQGGFVGVDCYVSSVDRDRALDQGCDFYAGYFKSLNDNNAISAQLTRHEYSNGLNNKWDFSDVSLSWHPNKKSNITLVYANEWLNRSFDSYALKAGTQISISEDLGLNLSASVMHIESGAPVNNLVFAKASLSYVRTRWTTELGLIYTDKDQRRVLPFDVDEAEILLSISYRLY